MKHFVFGKNWSKHSAFFILDEIQKVINENSKCNIIVTGGSSAKRVYLSLGKFENFQKLKNVFFYLSDERCVSLTSKFCNYKMIKKSLLKNNKNKFYKINSNLLLNGNYKFYNESGNLENEINFKLGLKHGVQNMLKLCSLPPREPYQKVLLFPPYQETISFFL